MPDFMDHIQEQQLREADARQASARMPTIQAATARDCDACGEPIPSGRLQACPGTELCLECASIREARARGYRR